MQTSSTMGVAPLRAVQRLLLAAPVAPGAPPHVSAASGIAVLENGTALVIADDIAKGVRLIRRRRRGWQATAVPGLPGRVYDSEAQRSRNKPDLEALATLPRSEQLPNGGVLAVPSGSASNHERAMFWASESDAASGVRPQVIRMGRLYAAMKQRLGESLNIEGLAVRGGEVLFFHRGNDANSRGTAIIRVPLSVVASYCSQRGATPVASGDVQVQRVGLGDLNGTPLAFSDAHALPDGHVLFTASAEATGSSNTDGAIVGSVIGLLDAEGRVVKMMRTKKAIKLEGVAVDWKAPGGPRILVVTDADKPRVAAQLLSMPLAALTGR